jgi:arylsulfatase A-like enzyme
MRSCSSYDPSPSSRSNHTLLQPPQASLDQFAHVEDWRRRRYLALVHYIDGAVGEVVAALKVKGMWEDTLVVMSSDNGGPSTARAPRVPPIFH